VYPCTCTRSDVAEAASAPHGEESRYPGTCAHRRAADAAQLGDRPFAWRFRQAGGETLAVSEGGLPRQEVLSPHPALSPQSRGEGDTTVFVDGYRGPTHIDAGGDFVIWKSAGTPAYQLAVVVDDAAMGITEVIRGDDLIPSTPRQLLLYRALGYSAPQFIH